MKAKYIILLAMGLAGAVFGQGSLTPPGAPGATMKTLDQLDTAIGAVSNAVGQIQDESRIDLATVAGTSASEIIITNSGSYYLSANLQVSKTYGIYVNATDVTLDLNGFKIIRSSGSGGYGIYINIGKDRAVVRNGFIAGFYDGIYSYSATGCRFEKLTVSDCSDAGIYVGSSSQLINCLAQDNAGVGIVAGASSILSRCAATGNQGTYSIYTSSGSTLTGCNAYNNQGNYGIYAGSGSTLTGCNAYNNVGTDSSSYGVYAGSGSTVLGCSACYNSNTNSPSTSIQGIGIYAGAGSLVKDCTASYNRGDGIRVGNDSSVIGNTCDNNGNSGDGAGIHATSGDNRIEGNNVTDNDRGIDVDSSWNFIARNTASGNTLNWDVASGNVCLVVQAATTPGAISGNSGGTAPGSTDPNANFSY